MAKLIWDIEGEHFYETGVEKVVLYPKEEMNSEDSTPYKQGYAWNGITSITESSDGGDSESIFADDLVYLRLVAPENIKFSISAYTYPDEFGECDGTATIAVGTRIRNQRKKIFGLCYKTICGNDTV